ncbi:MAG: hypothetical protein JST75_16805 [Bacteroidetes bacterium]|nr:hypothetical protein [Bacteroidota bacterium]
MKTVLTLILATTGYLVCHYLFYQHYGFGWIVLRSAVFILIYLPATIYFKVSPDIMPVWETVKKRLVMLNAKR